MKNNKTLETAGAAGIATIFIGGFIIYFNIIQQIIQFILNLPVSSIHH